jgi:hypothetical protein
MKSVVDKVVSGKIAFDSNKIRAGATDFYNLNKTVQTYAEVYKKILE